MPLLPGLRIGEVSFFSVLQGHTSLCYIVYYCLPFYKHPNVDSVNSNVNSNYLTLLLENQNRIGTFYFFMDDFNINLMKINSEYDNLQFCNTICS